MYTSDTAPPEWRCRRPARSNSSKTRYTCAGVAPVKAINSSTATIYRHAEDRPQTEADGELGAGFSSYDHDHSSLETDTMAIAGGVFWSPVSQLKMGVLASLVDIDNSAAVAGYKDEEQFNAAFVTWWNF